MNTRWIFGKTRILIAITFALAVPVTRAQSSQTQSQQPGVSQSTPSLPDAPSAVQPPSKSPVSTFDQDEGSPSRALGNVATSHDQESAVPPPVPAAQTLSPETTEPASSLSDNPTSSDSSKEKPYKIVVNADVVQIPVMVKNSDGRSVDGLLPKDFIVKENGEPQALTFFTSDPFPLSVAIVFDLGMADAGVQQVNGTYDSLAGAFSPYDEVSLYTYSSVVSQVIDFTGRSQRLTATLDSLKSVRGRNNGPAILGGPLGPQPMMLNGFPVGTAGPPPVLTPPKESHVLNDALLQAALDLSKRDRTRRKIIVIISDGRERGSRATYAQVVKVLQTHGIQVKAVVIDQGALPVYKELAKASPLLWGRHSNPLPRYTKATGGGTVFFALSRGAIEKAYLAMSSEARYEYTIGYIPKPVNGGGAYRNIEVIVDRKNLQVYAKDGYYPIPSIR